MLEPSLNDDTLQKRLKALCPDGLTIFTLEGDTIRGILSSATTMVAMMRAAHGLGLLETEVLGRAFVASSLLSATIKGEDRVVMKVEGDGPAQGFSVECNAFGDVRGRLFKAPFALDSPPGSLDTGPLVGAGSIMLTRFMAGATEPVSGRAELRSGRIAEDLSWYYHVSEQTRTLFKVGLHFDAEGRVAGAGGLFLQAMPGASDEALDRVERLAYGMDPLGETFASGATRMDVCLRSFPFFDYNHLDERTTRFYCGCSKDRLGAYIGALPADELADMASDGPFPLTVTCHNCGSAYTFSKEELEEMVRYRTIQ
ncbi:MAG: Hsp33 family molecular chaperone HslO [Spirochaetes bacterium]|nr:Hsp33 family molecular chaperone HslO [Spirochaetota bacterium]MBU1079161.1 Hsp33 family molecular chaperone HslO [Spirochaetota bacterium]